MFAKVEEEIGQRIQKRLAEVGGDPHHVKVPGQNDTTNEPSK
jgi:hypothetical protein